MAGTCDRPGDPHELAADAIAARFRWARRQGHPAWLWPDVQLSEWRVASSELERVAALLLAEERPVRLAAPGAERLQGFGVALHTSGMGGWLGWQAERGVLACDAGVAALLAAHLAHGRRRAPKLLDALRWVVRVLDDAGVRSTVLKGMHGARRWFAEPALRPMADLDVRVEPGAVARAERALAAAGCEPSVAGRHRRPHRSEWRLPGAPRALRSLTLTHADDPYGLDLHGTLDIDFFGVRTVRFDGLVSGVQEPAPEFGARALVLKPPLLVVHHAVHASHGLHGLTMIRLVELTLMLRRTLRTEAHWAELAEVLRLLGAERFAYPAFALVEKLAPGTVQPRLLARLERAAPPRLAGIVHGLRPATVQRLDGLALDERFMWASTPLEHLRRAAHMVLPTGMAGPARRLARIYADRLLRIVRRRVSLSASE